MYIYKELQSRYYAKCKQHYSGFEYDSLIPFPSTLCLPQG